jgi:hypothetical protein
MERLTAKQVPDSLPPHRGGERRISSLLIAKPNKADGCLRMAGQQSLHRLRRAVGCTPVGGGELLGRGTNLRAPRSILR